MDILDGEGEKGDLPGYTLTQEDLQLKEAYGYWLHANDGNHSHRGVTDKRAWKGWWWDISIMPSNQYGALVEKLGRYFVGSLNDEFCGVQDRRWNLE